MNKITGFIIGAVAVVSMIIGIVAMNKHAPVQLGAAGQQGIQGPKGNTGPVGPMGPRGYAGADGSSAPVKLGALTGPDIPSPYLIVGGVTYYYARQALNTATTTPCAIQAPVSTSTLVFASLNVTTATSTATTWSLATSTNAYATTTLISSALSLASGILGSYSFSATTSPTYTPITPGTTPSATSTYLVWGVAGVDRPSDTSKLNGFCQAQWRVL